MAGAGSGATLSSTKYAVAVQAREAGHWHIIRSLKAVWAYEQALDPPFDFDLSSEFERRLFSVSHPLFPDKAWYRMITHKKIGKRDEVRCVLSDSKGILDVDQPRRRVVLIVLPSHKGAGHSRRVGSNTAWYI